MVVVSVARGEHTGVFAPGKTKKAQTPNHLPVIVKATLSIPFALDMDIEKTHAGQMTRKGMVCCGNGANALPGYDDTGRHEGSERRQGIMSRLARKTRSDRHNTPVRKRKVGSLSAEVAKRDHTRENGTRHGASDAGEGERERAKWSSTCGNAWMRYRQRTIDNQIILPNHYST